VVDDDGLRIMVDRYKDIVKSGGENGSSMRVESVLHAHPGVLRAAVTAVVVSRPGAVADENDEPGFCRDRLAGFERPKRVVFADGLPETVGGKVLKYKLRAQLAELYGG
jgi:acyl-CoA synthetase (AMP-forming)/AMP-acid ligase II